MIDVNESKLIALCRDLDLSLVVLFGSQAQGQARDDSDIDIAVLSDRVWDQALESDYQAKVWESFLWLFSRADVDVIFLNQVSSLLGYKIMQTGQVIYEARPNLWRDFSALAVKRHADAQKFYNLKGRYVRSLLKESTMLDEIYVNEKLARLSEYLNDLRQVARYSYEEYANDLFVKRTGERTLELIVECAVDINNHFIVEVGLRPPAEYFRSFLEMSNLGLISADLSNALAPTAGLRNRLAHEYETIVDRIVYNAIGKMILDYSEYVSQIQLWLSENRQ